MQLRHCSFFLTATLILGRSAIAFACGGFFCDTTQVITDPPEQDAERIVFALNAAGWDEPPEAMTQAAPSLSVDGEVVDDTPVLDPEEVGPSVDAYIEISYTGAAENFAWIVPLLEMPRLIGLADPNLFDAVDRGTAPRFTFTSSAAQTTFVASDAGGCGSAAGGGDLASAGGFDDNSSTHAEVTVLSRERVGPYDVSLLSAENGSALRDWLLDNRYQIPSTADALLDVYIDEQKVFAAFRLADGVGVGAIQPVVLRIPGTEPCIPLRLTPVASAPVINVDAYFFADSRVSSTNFTPANFDFRSVRPDSPSSTDYRDRARDIVVARGGQSFLLEFAGNPSLLANRGGMLYASAFGRFSTLTRLHTQIDVESMTDDPMFAPTGSTAEIIRDETIDITNDRQALEAIGFPAGGGGAGVGGGVGGSRGSANATGGDDSGGCDCRQSRLRMPLWPVMSLAGAMWLRRRRRA